MLNPNAKHDIARIDQIIAEIKQSIARPNWKPETSSQILARANRQRDIVSTQKQRRKRAPRFNRDYQ
jgi:hypothetical protein